MFDFNLSSIEPICQLEAAEALKKGEAESFVLSGYSFGACLKIVCDNVELLRERGIYERALIAGYTGGKTNHSRIPLKEIERLFAIADKQALRSCGASLPAKGPLTLYRGVSGSSQRRRVRGFSWTTSFQVACYFANASAVKNPAVYETSCEECEVLYYTNEREEQEYIVQPRITKLLPVTVDEIKHHAHKEQQRRERKIRKKIENLRNSLRHS